MLKKLYEKNEVLFAVVWIVIYVMVMGNLQAAYGIGSLYSLLGLLVIGGLLIFWLEHNHLLKDYGFTGVRQAGKYLYFVPLVLIGSVNLWGGVKLHYDLPHQMYALMAMAVSGVVEEVLFRGLLFRAIEKQNRKKALIISSVTFGVGHIVNLLIGQASLETFLQVLYAIAIGFAFVMTAERTGSLVPCMITHSVINMTAELSGEVSTVLMYVQVVFLIVVSCWYAQYLARLKSE